MSVDVSVTYEVVDREGHPVFPVQAPTVFNVARTRRSGGWQTVVTYRKRSGPHTRAAGHPLDGARVVYDESTRTTHFYDADGKLDPSLSNGSNKPLPAAPSARTPAWLDGLVAAPTDGAARRRELQQRYGPSVGRVGDLERFVIQREDVLEEVLADSESGLALEINSVRNGILENHIVFEYERAPDASWVRRRMRSEGVVPGDAGHRTRMTLEFWNLRTGGEAR